MSDPRTIFFVDDIFCQPGMQENLTQKFAGIIKDKQLTPVFSTAKDRNSGYSVRAAMAAMHPIKKNLALAVIDLQLGKDNYFLGLEIIRNIRRSKPHVPIVCYTGMKKDELGYNDVEVGLRHDAAILIHKGASAEEITKRLQRVVPKNGVAARPTRTPRKRAKPAAAARPK